MLSNRRVKSYISEYPKSQDYTLVIVLRIYLDCKPRRVSKKRVYLFGILL